MAESDDPDAIEAQIEQLVEEQANLHGEVYDNMSEFYAEALSDNWTDRMQMSLGMDLQAQSVQGSFTKKRKLPPEADSYMVEFYLDPIESFGNAFAADDFVVESWMIRTVNWSCLSLIHFGAIGNKHLQPTDIDRVR